MQLKKVLPIQSTIHLISGLHIGAGNETMEIGGLDNPIIKHPITSEPYIPGSSIKGKMRSLLELKYNRFTSNGQPCHCGELDCPICTIFGIGGAERSDAKPIGPTRLLVRDAFMTSTWQSSFKQGELPMEVKYENIINRLRGTADHPRPLERVPAGVEFDCAMSLRVFDMDNENGVDTEAVIKEGLALLQLDALGGCGSRGCGQIRFDHLRIDGREIPEEELHRALQEAA